ncbi:hypothetical protein [Gimesia sp.]|uniref:hypothetical protein n=1 Tax=Gimesia sp. TaxID=2024833 RepID=UPI003A9288B7
MESTHGVIEVSATPEYVLSVFQDQQRLYFLLDYDEHPREVLSFESTIEEWRSQMDLVGWRALGRAENKFWKMNLSDQEWRQVLKPEREKTLRGVCALIAQHASTPVIREVIFFGKPCRPASVFLTIRALLQEAGADVSEIAPSTLLVDYTSKYSGDFLWTISRLAPGTMPEPRIENQGLYQAADLCLLWTIGASLFFLFFISICVWVLIVPACLFLIFLSLRWKYERQGGRKLQLGTLKTFRDLSELIAQRAAFQA